MNKEKFLQWAKLTLTDISDVNAKKLTKTEKEMFEQELLQLWNTIYVNCEDIKKRYNKD